MKKPTDETNYLNDLNLDHIMFFSTGRTNLLFPESKPASHIFIKIVIVVMVIIMLSVSSIWSPVSCENITMSSNNETFKSGNNFQTELVKSGPTAYTVMLVSSFSVDILLILFFIFWINTAKSWRAMAALLVYIYIQITFQLLHNTDCSLVKQSNEAVPHFLTILNSKYYSFISLVIGIPVIIALEFKRTGYIFSSTLAWLIVFIQALHSLSIKSNSIIEILCSAIISHYTFLVVDSYLYVIDKSTFRLKEEDDFLDQEDCLV